MASRQTLTWESLQDQYPEEEMKKLKKATVRSAVKNIAKKLPDVNAMKQLYDDGFSKFSKKGKEAELAEYKIGCSVLEIWCKDKGIPNFKSNSGQGGAQPGASGTGSRQPAQQNASQKPQKLTESQKQNEKRLVALRRCEEQANAEQLLIAQGQSAKHTPNHFRTMKKSSIRFNEQGNIIISDKNEQQEENKSDQRRNVDFGGRGRDEDGPQDPNEKFFKPNEQRPFEEVVREQVYNCLLYRGDLQLLMTQDYFVGDSFKDQYHYCASAKVPFYMIYHSSPMIQDELAAKYLENPANPVMFMQYDQKHPGFENLTGPAPELQRQFNIRHLYNKLKSEMPTNNLLCIGSPSAGKSDRLNDMFAVSFEKRDPRACGLWHDSVDVIFSSNDIPLGFNVYDFHGKMANYDFQMIADLFEWLPNTYLLVQVIDKSYLEKLQNGVGNATFEKMKQRMIIVSNSKNESKKDEIQQVAQGFGIRDSDTQDDNLRHGFYHFGDLGNGDQQKAMAEDIFKQLQQNTKKLKQSYEEELTEQKALLMQAKGLDASEYKEIHGLYWYLEDSLTHLQTQHGNSIKYNVDVKDPVFRQRHRAVKQLLVGYAERDLLKREEVFRFYMNTLRQVQITNELKTNFQLTKDEVTALKMEKQQKARDSSELEPHPLFMQYFELLMDMNSSDQEGMQGSTPGKSEQIYDMLNLVEAYYKRGMKDRQVPEKEKQDYVLDSELFSREARYYTRTEKGKQYQEQYARAVAGLLDEGKAIEIIDGDIDKLEKDSLSEVMDFVDKKRKGNSKLVVITILGPQSSGKSTLLNFLTGAKFHVSAGRCTKGLNAMLLKTEFNDSKEVLILDSEGLFSIERNDPKYDRRLAIFCFSVSNYLLINIKGELNTQVKEVLQVSIYALKRIKEISNVNNSARPHFICRDINSGTTKDIQIQFDKIKLALEEAAEAAECKLHQLLSIENSSEMMDTFHGAIDKHAVYANEVLTQTKSHGGFRDECGRLRRRLMDFSKSLDKNQRPLNLKKLIEDMSIVWTAVTENDDLVLIKDLRHINDHRNLERAMAGFKRIMQANNQGENDPHPQGEENPLLKAQGSVKDELKKYKKIMPEMRLFAVLDVMIQNALKKQNQEKTEEGLESLEQDTMKEMRLEVEKWWQPSGNDGLAFQMAKFFTEEMSQDLQHLAKFFAKTYIEAIHKKAIRYFKKEYTENKIKKKITIVNAEVRKYLHENEVDEVNLFIQQKFGQLKADLYKDLPQQVELTEKANAKLKQYCQYVYTKKTEFRSVMSDPAPLSAAFDYRETLATLDYIKVLVEEDDALEAEGFNIDEAIKLIIQADEAPLKDCIDNWVASGNNRAYKQDDLIREQTIKMNESVKKRFTDLKTEIRGLIVADEQNNSNSHLRELSLKKNRLDDYHNIFCKVLKNRNTLSNQQQNDRDIIANLDHDPCWQDKDGAGFTFASKCYKLNLDQNMFFTTCEALILHRLDTQNRRNLQVQQNDVDAKLEKAQQELNNFFAKSQKEVEGEQGIAIALVEGLIIERAKKELIAIHKEKWRRAEQNLDSKFSKKTNGNIEGNMEKTMNRFIGASQNDIQFIILHMKKPVEAEKIVFEEEWAKELETTVSTLKDDFTIEMNHVLDHLASVFTTLKSTFQQVGDHVELTDETYQNLIQYVYYLVFYNQWKNEKEEGAQEEPEETVVQKFRSHKELLEKEGTFVAGTVGMPELPDLEDENKRVFRGAVGAAGEGYSEESWTEDKMTIDRIVSELVKAKVKLGYLFSFVNIRDIITQEKIQLYEQEIQTELTTASQKIEAKERIFKAVLGCLGECPFCGARCEENEQCKAEAPNKKDHNTRFHRPMAFKGSHEFEKVEVQKVDANGNGVVDRQGNPVMEIKSTKILLSDHCLSHKNLVESRWKDSSGQDAATVEMLERINKSVELNGINIILEWKTGNDLDIHTKCGCGKWTDTPYNIKCDKCGMKRDIDMRSGKNNRKAVEHIIYSKPDELIGKELGVYVQNYLPQGNAKEVKFTVKVLNKYKRIIWPEEGKDSGHQEWMKTPNQNQGESERKVFTYTKAMHDAGVIDFKTHLANIMKDNNDADWAIDENRMNDAKNSEDALKYMRSWNEKWDLVKETLCGPAHYECQVLESLPTEF